MLSKFFCYACVFFCIPALACVFFSKAHQFTSKKTQALQTYVNYPGFYPDSFVKCASRQARVSLSSIVRQSDCPLIYCIIAELHFQMPSFRYSFRYFIRYFWGGFRVKFPIFWVAPGWKINSLGVFRVESLCMSDFFCTFAP